MRATIFAVLAAVVVVFVGTGAADASRYYPSPAEAWYSSGTNSAQRAKRGSRAQRKYRSRKSYRSNRNYRGTRTADSVKNVPPLVEPHPQSMQLMWSNSFISILLKEGHAHAPRMWMRAVKVSGQFVPVGGKFVHQTLEQQILKFFSAGTQRDVGASPPWKTFAGQPKGQTELWLRPGWKAAELWPDQITVPKTPALNPKTAEHRKAYHDAMARKRKQARIMEAKGYRQETATKGTMAGAKVWKRA